MASAPETLFATQAGRRWRKWRGIAGFGATAVATLFTLGALVSILGYLVIHGIGAINWSFLVKEPAAVGEAGGGIAPSLLGTAILVTISSIVGIPLGVGVGIYLIRTGSRRSLRSSRAAGDQYIYWRAVDYNRHLRILHPG